MPKELSTWYFSSGAKVSYSLGWPGFSPELILLLYLPSAGILGVHYQVLGFKPKAIKAPCHLRYTPVPRDQYLFS